MVPFTLVQLTDPHLGASWSPDPAGALTTAIAAVGQTLTEPPDGVIVSGDIASTPADAEYEQARAILGSIGAPVYVLAGNHDDRDGLRRHFDLPPTTDGSVSYAVDLDEVRLVALDSTRPGETGGQLDAARLEWLDSVLGEDRTTPTLLAMHHPPLVTGIPAMDAIGIPGAERQALGEIVSRHRQVQVIAAGHVHRAIVGQLAGTTMLAIPSTDEQLRLDFESDELTFTREPPCFAVHVLVEGHIVSHIQPVQCAGG